MQASICSQFRDKGAKKLVVPLNKDQAWMLRFSKFEYQHPSSVFREGPLLVVASGRDTWPIAAEVKRLAPSTTFVVQVRRAFCFKC
jgi:hypothetical protein